MTKKILSIILIFSAYFANSQTPEIVWEKTFGDENSSQKLHAIAKGENCYWIAGEKKNNEEPAFWVAKTDINGDTLWSRTRPEENDNTHALGVTQTSDLGVVAVGHISNAGLLLVKYDANGNFLWETVMHTQSQTEGHSILEDKDGNIVVAGYTMVGATGASDAWFAKFDANGNFIKQEYIGQAGAYSFASSIKETNFGYIATGYMPDTDFAIFKLDHDLNEIERKVLPDAGIEIGYDVFPTFYDYGFIATGRTSTNTAGSFDIIVIKYDSNLEVEWIQLIGGTSLDTGYEVIQSAEGFYYVAGMIMNTEADTDHTEISITKLDGQGNIVTNYVVTSEFDAESKGMIQIENGNLVVVGHKNFNHDANPQFWISEINIFENPDNQKNILFFNIEGETANAQIDTANAEINIEVNSEIDITSISPSIIISAGASISPEGQLDFSAPVEYVVTAADNSEKTWTVNLSQEVGVEQTSMANIKIFPIPTTGIINLSGFENLTGLTISNINGKTFKNISNINSNNFLIDISDLPNGIYILKLKDGNNCLTKKIIKN